MKKKLIIVLTVIASLLLAGCGMSARRDEPAVKWSNSMAMDESLGGYYADNGLYETGGDYSSTTISGDKVDYSYTFSAEGDTYKDKAAMLKDYEAIQNIVNEKDGYIESVYNSYDYYSDEDIEYNDVARKYIARGSLSFTVQIENQYVQDIVNYLETLCQNNQFTVTSYTQRIQNYKSWKVVDEYDENQRGRVISDEDLKERLKYADISVNICYNIPRNKVVAALMGIKVAISDFFDGVRSIVTSFLALAVGLFILYIQAILFYKGFVKTIHKHKRNHPEYYPPKDVHVITDGSVYNDFEQ